MMISTDLSKSDISYLSTMYLDFLYISLISSQTCPISYKSFYYNFSWFFLSFLFTITLVFNGFLFSLYKLGSQFFIYYSSSSFLNVYIRCLKTGRDFRPLSANLQSLNKFDDKSISARLLNIYMLGRDFSRFPFSDRLYRFQNFDNIGIKGYKLVICLYYRFIIFRSLSYQYNKRRSFIFWYSLLYCLRFYYTNTLL